MYRKHFKRPIEVTAAICALIILSPVLLIVAILIKINLGSPIIFNQKRPGLNENIFTLYKFRTMTDKKDENGILLSDELRLTKFGSFLRSTSLDELPELWNIIRGDMAFVGPRPQLILDMVFMTPEQRKRHIVRPGLSGLAQIKGRNSISWEDKLSYDLEYIENINFIEDVKIVFLTLRNVFVKEGISAEGMATAENLGDYLLRRGIIDEKWYSKKVEESSRY